MEKVIITIFQESNGFSITFPYFVQNKLGYCLTRPTVTSDRNDVKQ